MLWSQEHAHAQEERGPIGRAHTPRSVSLSSSFSSCLPARLPAHACLQLVQANRTSFDEGLAMTLNELFWPTAVRQVASGSAASPDRTMALTYMENCAALIETMLAGEGGKVLIPRIAADADSFSALAAALWNAPKLPSFAAQLHLTLALFRFRRHLKKCPGGPGLVARLQEGCMVSDVSDVTTTAAPWFETNLGHCQAAAAEAVGSTDLRALIAAILLAPLYVCSLHYSALIYHLSVAYCSTARCSPSSCRWRTG